MFLNRQADLRPVFDCLQIALCFSSLCPRPLFVIFPAFSTLFSTPYSGPYFPHSPLAPLFSLTVSLGGFLEGLDSWERVS